MTPLAGVQVLELTTMITGPLAGMLLADMGASVIKIENPDRGDPFRSFRGGLYGGHFLAYNRNKKSLALDLRSEDGKRILLDLIRRSDVLIDNFRHGVLDRLGATNEVLIRENPRLIHASITGFGSAKPYRNRPAYDAVAQALSGLASQFLDPQQPQVQGPTLSDNITGFYAAYAILSALYAENERYRAIRSSVPGIAHPYVNVGLIAGGTNTNVVPGKVILKLDRRMIPEEDPAQVESEIRAVIQRAAASVPGVGVDIRRMLLARALQPDTRNGPLVDALRQHAEAVFGEPIPAVGTPLYTDVRLYAAAGAACALYGAGPRTVLESNAKRADEHVALADLRGATKVIARSLRDLLA